MATTKKAKQLVENYITAKVVDSVNETNKTRTELMLEAGYTTISTDKNNVELTKLYSDISSDLINKTGFSLQAYIKVIEGKILKGEHEKQSIGDIIKQSKTLLDIYKGLAPSFKTRETTKDSEGNLKTVWTQLN